MMKKLPQFLKNSFCMLLLSLLMSSCFVARFNVGEGPEHVIVEKGKNHYFLFGIVPGNRVNVPQMADDKKNYKVTFKHSFVDVVLSIITIGIYTPTTVIIER
jgi:hypothetical protein